MELNTGSTDQHSTTIQFKLKAVVKRIVVFISKKRKIVKRKIVKRKKVMSFMQRNATIKRKSLSVRMLQVSTFNIFDNYKLL